MRYFPNEIQIAQGETTLLSLQDSGGSARAQNSNIAILSDVISEDDQYVVQVSGGTTGETVVWLSDGSDQVEVPVTVIAAPAPAPSTVPNVTFKPSQMAVLYQSGRYGVTVMPNSMVDTTLMTATSNADWITLVSLNAAKTRMEFTVGANTGGERVGSITLTWLDDLGGSHRSVYSVTQYGRDEITEEGELDSGLPTVVLNTSDYEFSSFEQGKTFSFETVGGSSSVIYGIAYNVSDSWISAFTAYRGAYTVRVEENRGSARVGYVDVILQGGGETSRATMRIAQDAWNGEAAIEFNHNAYPNPFTVSYASTAGNFSLMLRNISSVTATTDSTWMSATYENEYDTPRCVCTWSENMGAERTTVVTVSGTGTNGVVVSDTLTIKQQQNPDYVPSIGVIEAPGSVVFSWKGEEGTLPVQTINMDETTIVASKYHPLPYSLDWITVEYVPNQGIVYSLQNNTTASARTCYVDLTGTATDNIQVQSRTLIRQEAYSAPISFPIWQDKIYTIQSDDSYVDYTITTADRVIYEGRAYPMNGSVDVNVAEIMRGRIKQELNLEGSGYVWLADQGGYINFDLNVNGLYTASYAAYNDWSYELNNPPIMSEPVRMECMAGQILPFSLTVTDTSLYVEDEGSEGNEYILPNGNTTIMHTVTEGEGELVSFRVGSQSIYRDYKVISDCYEYYLIYRNLYGGYDSFIPKGNHTYKEAYTPSTYKRNVVNDRSGDGYVYPQRGRATVTYQVDIKPTWEFRTDWLTDEEAKRMRHLFSSNEVWLCKSGELRYWPVSITDKSYKELTYKNNGRKKVNYTINCQLDETRMRR